jgi:hypothetical protein
MVETATSSKLSAKVSRGLDIHRIVRMRRSYYDAWNELFGTLIWNSAWD